MVRHPWIFLVPFLVCVPALSQAGDLIPTNSWCDYFSYGSTLDGQPLPVGAVIDAYDPDGVHCGTFTVHTEGLYGYLHVYGDDPLTDIDEGAVEGNIIAFYINGAMTATSGDSVWIGGPPGGTFEVDLSAPVEGSLTSIVVSPVDTAIAVGDSVLFRAWGTYLGEKAVVNVTDWVTWASSDAEIVLIGNESGTKGSAVPTGLGTAVIRAVSDAVGDSTTLTIYRYGDVNSNRDVNERDAVLILQHAVGLIDLSFPNPPEWLEWGYVTADVSGALGITPYDAALVLQYTVNLIREFPVQDRTPSRKVIGDERIVTLGDLLWGPDGYAVASISIDNMEGVLSAQMELLFDSSILQVIQVKKPERLGGYLFASKIEGDRVSLSLACAETTEGSEEIARICFRSLGTSRIRGRSISWHFVQLNEGGIPARAISEGSPFPLSPVRYHLSPNYPNPFNPETTVCYGLPQAGVIDLSVYNVTGQRIRALAGGEKEAGFYSAIWDGKDSTGMDVASGIYLYRLEAEGFSITKKAVLTR